MIQYIRYYFDKILIIIYIYINFYKIAFFIKIISYILYNRNYLSMMKNQSLIISRLILFINDYSTETYFFKFNNNYLRLFSKIRYRLLHTFTSFYYLDTGDLKIVLLLKSQILIRLQYIPNYIFQL